MDATSREERMQQRMRGAGRHEVADDSFGFIVPAAEESPEADPLPQPPPPPPPPRSEPNTSAKRRRLNSEARPGSSQQQSSSSRASARLSARKASPENGPELQPVPSPVPEESAGQDDSLESMPPPAHRPLSQSPVTSRLSVGPTAEEVTESPATAPGSGRRRQVRLINAVSQSANLQKAVMEAEGGAAGDFTTSSPLARKTRTSGTTITPAAPSARSTRASTRQILPSPLDVVDELPPSARPPRESNGTASTGSARSTRSQTRRGTLGTVIQEPNELSSPPDAAGTSSSQKPQPKVKKAKALPPPPEIQRKRNQGGAQEEKRKEAEDGAEEINVRDAARRIGRKRPRVSPPRQESPELHAQQEKTHPARTKRTKRTHVSPATQSQPKAAKSKSKPAKRRRSDGDGEAIPITVQRYTKPAPRDGAEADEDVLNADIPYANRSGVNVIDVLSQMCEEVIETNMEKLHEAAVNAQDSATRKEFRTKLRTLEAFLEELRTRFLEHTIALDDMHALQKRVRAAQKEKLALRTEILRIRAEREQVALKTDAVRMRHETANRESLHQLGLSSTMDDIELAVENGKTGPDLVDPREQKTAELANLDLLISTVAGQAGAGGAGRVSGGGGGGGEGNLKQIKDFNAMLERAAAVLEGR
ncbi:hypothetical protein GGR56DRAFT_558308 [Xylariaceae sp. FL0804]|nr:hypothetical protein GGR56DRAFT_558308 [Xylariaceae sp. FL0804]